MKLKTKVFIKNITNLSDARYCAGMMVDYIGFDTKVLSTNTFKEIKNWLSGVETVIDAEGPLENIQAKLSSFPAEAVRISSKDFNVNLKNLNLPIFLQVDLEKDNLPDLFALAKDYVQYFVVSGENLPNILETWAAQYPILIDHDLLSKEEFSEIGNSSYAGLVLTGGEEERPGYRDFGDLMEILEELEEE
jgi:phosphoribosylanthranilate isomerase